MNVYFMSDSGVSHYNCYGFVQSKQSFCELMSSFILVLILLWVILYNVENTFGKEHSTP